MGRRESSEGKDGGDTTSISSSGSKVELKKTVGLFGGLSFVVGTVIGSGIFISPTGIARGSGSVGLSLIAWVVCGAISMAGALTFCELGSFITRSGSIYIYLLEAFGPVPAFLFSWMELLVRSPGSAAVISMTFAQYLFAPLFNDGCGAAPAELRAILAVLLVLSLTALNIYDARIGTSIQIIFTIAKVAALILIIIGGIVMMAQGYTEFLASGFEGSNTNIGQVAMGFYSGMFAYSGWERVPALYEEMKNPARDIPISIVGGLIIIIALYVLANVSYFTVMDIDDILESTAVAYTWGERVITPVAWLMPVSVAASTLGSCNSALFVTSRISFVSAREGHLPGLLEMIDPQRFTPSPSILMQCILVIIYIIPGDIGSLISALTFVQTFFTMLVGIGAITMRFTHKDVERPIKMNISIPIIFILANLFLLIMPLIQDPQWAFLFAIIFTLAGLLLYIPCVYFGLSIPGTGLVTQFFQLFMGVCPGDQSKKAEE